MITQICFISTDSTVQFHKSV